jgi:hypothetical protein
MSSAVTILNLNNLGLLGHEARRREWGGIHGACAESGKCHQGGRSKT